MNTRISEVGSGAPAGATTSERDVLHDAKPPSVIGVSGPDINSSQGTYRVNLTAVVAGLIQSEGIEVVAGCEHDRSSAGSILALLYGCQRWRAEAAVRAAIRIIGRQVDQSFLLPGDSL